MNNVPRILGVVMIVVAVVMCLLPSTTLEVMAIVCGVMLVIGGAFDLAGMTILSGAFGLEGLSIKYPLIEIVIGVLFIVFPLFFGSILPILVGIISVLFGVFSVWSGWRIKNDHYHTPWDWVRQIFFGIVFVVIGIVLFVNPGLFSILMAIFVGINGLSLVLYGSSSYIISDGIN